MIRITIGVLAAAALVTGCSASQESADSAGGDVGAGTTARLAEEPAMAQAETGVHPPGASGAVRSADTRSDLSQDVIHTARLTVRTSDIGTAVDQARSIVAGFGGTVASESTSSRGDRGERSVLTLRVPAPRYADALEQLGSLGRVTQQNSSSEDVHLQVIDVETRVESAERTIDRLLTLLNRAEDLGDVIRLESELARREADLESLKGQLAYLEDQTALSTITLTLLPPVEEPTAEDATSGFLDGLAAGWDSLTKGLGVAVTVLGLVLPYAILFGLLGLGMWVLSRRLWASRRLGVHEVDDSA